MPLPFIQIMRDFVVDGVSSSGRWKPKKSEMRSWGAWVESLLNAIGSNSGTVYQQRALLFAELAKAANTMAWVINDPTVAYNGIYQKVGGTGTGSWTRVADLPYSFITAVDAGAGTPNAIQATSTIPISGSALVLLNIFEANTGSPVTLSFNGGATLAVKTNAGNDVIADGLKAGMQVLGVVSGATFRLVTDMDISAAVAQAEAAALAAADSAAEAAGYAAMARNDKVVKRFAGDGVTVAFDLTVDPGSKNNIDLFIDGVYQQTDTFSLAGTVVTLSEAPPVANDPAKPNNIEFKLGFAVTVPTPGNGTVSTAKIVDDAVTFAKIQNIPTASLLGRTTAGSGDVEVLSTGGLFNAIAPNGAMVDSGYAEYTANTSLSNVIPVDNTTPQNTEGTEILSVVITPKSTTNKLRVRFRGDAQSSTGPGYPSWAIFRNGVANAIASGYETQTSAGQSISIGGEVEFVPGSTSAITISVRAGPGTTGNMTFNGGVGAPIHGGSMRATLTVEEIKA
ncbi:hypothetical protein [Rhizobium sp. 768_B6_N1_8]|uniref:hypothetical protein n=1 Tax=unclassified Rhizobium TaxID=2613769 RepID=UPI003F28CAD3